VPAAGGSSFTLTSEDTVSVDARLDLNRNSRGRTRTLALRLLRGCGLLAFTLIFGETFVRILCPQPVMPRYVTGTAWGVRGNIPHARYWHYTPEVSVEYRINGQGMRADRDYPLRKPAGTCRIAVFGDSLLMGYEVDLRDSFTTRLEEQLRDRGWSVEVLNFSVSGFGTAEMLRTYEAFARGFDPDFVLFSWHLTDTQDNVRSALYRLRNGKLENANRSYLPGVRTQDFLMEFAAYRLVADHSQLYALLRERTGQFTKGLVVHFRQQPVSANQAAAGSGEEDEEDVLHAAHVQADRDLSSAIVEHAAQVVAADGREFYLVEIPIRVSRVEFRSSVDVLSAAILSQVRIISPLAAFERAARPDFKVYYEHGEGHLTPAGVLLLANEAAKTLARSPRLTACTTGSAVAPPQPSANPASLTQP
jgi:hypothetical protein